jgi:hypothetical protein
MGIPARLAPLRRIALVLAAIDAVVIAVSPGCGGEARAPAPREIPIDLPSKLAAASCARAVACCGDAGSPLDEAACPTQIAENLAGQWAELRSAYVAGEIDVDVTRAKACIAAVAALECPGSLRELFPHGLTGHALGDCAGVFEAHADGKCTLDVACPGDEVCAGGQCAAAPGCDGGACPTPLPNGAECASDDECASGHCQSSAYTCGSPLDPGEHCVQGSDCKYANCTQEYTCAKPALAGEPCNDDTWCLEGLYCHPTVDQGRLCEKPIAAGGTCEGTNPLECATGYCDPTTMKCASRHADGQPCASGDDCASGICGLSYTCTQGALGSPCGYDLQCASKRCDLGTGKCAPPLANESPCSANYQCATQVCVKGTCKDPGGQDADCEENADCAAGYTCFADSFCLRLQADGEPCDDLLGLGGSCLHGVCLFSPGKSYCAPRPLCQSG